MPMSDYTLVNAVAAPVPAGINTGDVVKINGELHWILDMYDDITFFAVSSDGEVMQFSVYDIESVGTNVPTNRFKEAVMEVFSQVLAQS